jgi:integrase
MMSKTIHESTITTKNARSRLEKGIHWRSIDPDSHIGYRKGARGGRWVARWYLSDQKYAQETLGSADDVYPANGVDILDFSQALTVARTLILDRRTNAKIESAGPIPTVKSAVHEYIERRETRERAEHGDVGMKRDTRSRLTKYVLNSTIADIPLHKLDDDELRSWRAQLPPKLKTATIKRLSNDLKACLNAAATMHRKKLPATFTRNIQEGLKVEAAEAAEARRQVLPDADIKRILIAARSIDEKQAWNGDLFRLLAVMASTGARMSQVIRMTVHDVQHTEKRLLIPVSFKGRGTKRIEETAVPVSDDILGVLRPITNGRSGSDPLFERWVHIQRTPTVWKREKRGPWKSPSELTRPWRAITDAAGLTDDLVPYCLRHSSIVRGLRNGLPTRLVAALHDTSVAMIEKHYAAYVVDAMNDLAAKVVVPLITDANNVVELRTVTN